MEKMELPDTEKLSPRFSKKHEGTAWRLWISVACALLGPFSFGYVIGYSSPAIPELEKRHLLDHSQSGWFASLITVGALFGGPLAGWSIEKYGRRATLRFTAIPFLLGWVLIRVEDFFVGRLLCGLASGSVTVCTPIYIAEVATSSLRGTLGACVQLFITLGILCAYSAGVSYSWSDMAEFGIVAAILMFVVLFFIPETPRWLLMNKTKAEAVLALQQLRNQHADCEDECRDIEEGLDVKETFTWSEFKKTELSRPLMISVVIMIFQQFSGINAVMFYTVSIFKSAGIDNSEMATVLIGVVQVVGTVIACVLMDRMGRRRLLIIGGSVMSLSCFMFGWYFHKVNTGVTDLGKIAVVCLVLYIIGFALGWGPIPMLIMSEIFPSRVRGAASGIAILANWMCAFIVTKEFVFIQDTFGSAATFWMFAVSCFCSVIYVWKKVPETKGKSLEDIELFFLGKSMMIA